MHSAVTSWNNFCASAISGFTNRKTREVLWLVFAAWRNSQHLPLGRSEVMSVHGVFNYQQPSVERTLVPGQSDKGDPRSVEENEDRDRERSAFTL